MKITKYYYAIEEGKFSISWAKDLDHRRELLFTFPTREFVLGFDW